MPAGISGARGGQTSTSSPPRLPVDYPTGRLVMFTYHVLPLKKLFRNDGGEAAEQVPATVNHNNLREGAGAGRTVVSMMLKRDAGTTASSVT